MLVVFRDPRLRAMTDATDVVVEGCETLRDLVLVLTERFRIDPSLLVTNDTLARGIAVHIGSIDDHHADVTRDLAFALSGVHEVTFTGLLGGWRRPTATLLNKRPRPDVLGL